ncbi:MAG: PAS domain-containing sensor histidine kinase, partial [Magnetospirillum sp.]
YSPVRADIGGESGSPAALRAALDGRSKSLLSSRTSIAGWNGRVADRYLVTTYTPLAGADGTVIGAFELDTDVTTETEQLYAKVVDVASFMVAIFIGLYCVLFLVVHRAARILVAQRSDLNTSNQRHKAQEEMLRLLLDSVAEGIYGMDDKGAVTFVNSAAARLTGWTPGELQGVRIHEVIHHTHADGTPFPATECPVHNTLLDGTVCKVAGDVFWRKDGTSLSVEYTATPVRRDNAITGTVTVFRDVTERLMAEAELVAAKEAAERANQAKTVFMSHMSHELRTPLNAILGYSEILADGLVDPADPAARSYADNIRQSGLHLLSIIDELLDITRIELGNYKIAPAEFDLPAMVEECITMARPQAKAKGLKLIFRHPPPIPLRSDRRALRQVLLNLIGNSVKYTASGGTIIMAVERHSDSVVVRVSDNGQGIPADQLEAVFEQFHRVDPLRADASRGVGLGLAICRRIMGLLGGRIWIESSPGLGTTAFVALDDPNSPTRTHNRRNHAIGTTRNHDSLPSDPADGPGGHEGQ